MKTQKVFKTENSILIVTASTDGTSKDNKYVSITADEIEPLEYSEAVNLCREYLEDGELWKMAVDGEHTTLGFNDWVEEVLSIDGEISQIDNSLYPEEIEIEGIDYIFKSRGCGCMHDEIKKVTDIFNELIELHLSKNIEKAEKLIQEIKTDNIDEKVIQFTKELI